MPRTAGLAALALAATAGLAPATLPSPAGALAAAAAGPARLWLTHQYVHSGGVSHKGSRTYQPPTGTFGPSGAFAVGASPDGTLVFVTGAAPGTRPDSRNYTTIAYATSTGHTSWISRYRGRQDYGVPSALAVSPTGRAVFVTGYLHGHDGSLIFGTVAYQP